MLRISWGLALLAVVAIALAARNPRLLIPFLIVFAVWYLTASRGPGRRR